MHFVERDHHDFRIYAGAREHQGGFVAGVAVRRIRASNGDELPVIYREDGLSGSHCWNSPSQALQFAINKGVLAVDLHLQRAVESLPA